MKQSKRRLEVQERRKSSKESKLKVTWNRVKNFFEFFGRTYVWSGILLGFLWLFLSPIVMTVGRDWFLNCPEVVIAFLFFPLWLSMKIMPNPLSTLWWITSLVVSIAVSLMFTYSVHRLRVWRKHQREM